MPDYVVLIATLGGLATFGIHGFVLGPLIAAMFMAVWGIWHGASLWFSTGSESVKAKNLARDPRCSISTERGDEAVIVEGVVERVTDQPALKRVYEVYQAKYGWSMEGESFYVLRPRVVFAFFEHADQFASTATRWRFD